MQSPKSMQRFFSSRSSPAAKLLQRSKPGISSVPRAAAVSSPSSPSTSTPKASDLLSKAESTDQYDASDIPSFYQGNIKLFRNSSAAIDLWAGWMARSDRLEKRDVIRTWLRSTRDLQILIPSFVLLIWPFQQYTLPFVFRVAPGLVPSSFYSKGVVNIKINAVQSRREIEGPKLVEALTKQVDSLGEGFVFDKSTVTAVALFKKMMLNTSTTTFSDLNELLYPLFVSRLTAGSCLANPSQFTSFLHFTAPQLFPRTRLLQWADWILKDDAMIRREGVRAMTWHELVEALEERGFTRLEGLSMIELQNTLTQHTKWTKLVMDAIVTKRSNEKQAVYVDDYAVVPKVARDLGLTSEELGGVATLLIIARALDVKV
ncbi:UNVERIFIED_CONTAM: hypothetical protein HDU68_002191 [Siphonaria sp. JEL0065]|nr:hypothetical protein HDU68_002191 [Siphonaria sp. JEL0065]